MTDRDAVIDLLVSAASALNDAAHHPATPPAVSAEVQALEAAVDDLRVSLDLPVTEAEDTNND